MNALEVGNEVMAMVNHKTQANLAKLSSKLRFLKGNYRLVLAWPIGALVIAALGWGILLASLNRDQHEHETAALHEAAGIAHRYAADIARTVGVVDQVALHVKFEWELSKGNLRLEDAMSRGLLPASSAAFVAIFDRDGVPLSTTSLTPTAGINVTGQPYFQVQKAATQDVLYIGDPAVGRITNEPVIHFSRRLVDRRGQFDGIVLVSVYPGYFTANYDLTSLGKNGMLGVAKSDGSLLATRTGDIVHDPQSPALLATPSFPTWDGSVWLKGNEWFADGRNRFVGWQSVEGLPLIALAALDEHDTLAPYLARRAAAIRYGLWATAALIAFKFIAMFLSMRLAWRKYQLDLLHHTYRIATEEGNEGFYIARAIRDKSGRIVDFMVVDANHRGAELFNLRREDLIGKTAAYLYEGEPLQRMLGRLRLAMDTGYYENELEVPAGGPVTARWLHLKVVRSEEDLAITMRDISDSKAHVQELERRGNEDALTGLPNRHWLQGYLPHAIERAAHHGQIISLLFVDLDGFKTVNDTMGHAAGDELLKIAAVRVKDAVRPQDHVVRLGGDEFVIILEPIPHKAEAALVAQRILESFRPKFHLLKGVHALGASIGISVYPADGENADILLQNADIAMYSVKTAGKGSYHFYEPKFYEALRNRVQKELELRHAIENDQFVMHYQPRVDLASGKMCSMEALVRWRHPAKGLLLPAEFIPLAEETGLILRLGELVIDKVCAQLAHWLQQNARELVPVSVNVSPRQINETDVPKILAAALARHQVDARLVEVEVTESSMMGNEQDVPAALCAMQDMGITLLVDDFGTGYSSLSQLQRLDFDVLKVDRAFTAEIEKNEQGKVFFTAIITMAHALGMRVVAEGVESARQVHILKSVHCDEIQGFYISKPLPAAQTQPVQEHEFDPAFA